MIIMRKFNMLIVPNFKTIFYGKRSFRYNGCNLWNLMGWEMVLVYMSSRRWLINGQDLHVHAKCAIYTSSQWCDNKLVGNFSSLIIFNVFSMYFPLIILMFFYKCT